MHFEATEENKLIYTDIFKKYHEIIETYITQVSFLTFIFVVIEIDSRHSRFLNGKVLGVSRAKEG